jgi:riboflavin kinase/FMN adenylyltransferase
VYGKHISVEFCLKLRNEQKFASLDALQAQLQQDIAAAKHYFAAH